MLIKNIYKSPLSTLLEKKYNNLVTLIAPISKHDRTKKVISGTGGIVSIVDIIAYQIGWGNLLLNWYQAGLQNKIPQMPGEGFTSWDYVELAHHFYKKYHYDGYAQQAQEFHTIVKKIIDITEYEYTTGNLDKEGIWEWCTLSSGKQWPLSKWIRVNTVAPYKRAISLINSLM